MNKDQKVWVVSQSGNITEVYLPNGQKGFVTSEQVEISTVSNPLGKTDEKGEFSTDLIALSQLTLKLQAEKSGEVSAIKEVKVVPQIGGKHQNILNCHGNKIQKAHKVLLGEQIQEQKEQLFNTVKHI